MLGTVSIQKFVPTLCLINQFPISEIQIPELNGNQIHMFINTELDNLYTVNNHTLNCCYLQFQVLSKCVK